MQQFDYMQRRKAFQEHLVNYYRKHVLKVTVFPLQSERYQADIGDIYFPPCMTVELQIGIRRSRNTREIRIHEILKKDGKSLKNIYILGEVGSGKTALCKCIVSHWCRAHEDVEFNTSESEEVKEMANYDFLFYISLRHSSDCNNIQTMLEKYFQDPILGKVLEKESDRCLIVLDGLDEWKPDKLDSSQFQTEGLPKRELCKDYIVITTSRQWKFDALQVRDSEIGQMIKLKGVKENLAGSFIAKTMKSLNDPLEVSVADFEEDFQKFPFPVLTQMPMFMQTLICLWYEGKLKGTSKCAIYSNVLDIFFKWHELKLPESQTDRKPEITEADASFQLPEYLSHYETCFNNKHVIEKLSSLAFETLFDRRAEQSFKFTSSTLKDANISGDMKKLCLEVGILLLDRSLPMLASVRTQSLYSFVHKSVQEYLSAVNLAVTFNTILQTSGDNNISDACKQYLLQIFGTSKTADDILEMSNVFIILCGLKPLLTTYVSEYIYNTATVDTRIIESRTDLDNDLRLISEIQRCTVDCFKESRSVGHRSLIYLGDIVINSEIGIDDIVLCLQEQLIVPEHVRSLYISETNERFTENALNCLVNFESLNALWYDRNENSSDSEKMDEIIFKILQNNTSQILSLSLKHINYLRTMIPFMQCLPAMHQLTALAITDTYLTHDACNFLSTMLSRATQLQQISLDIDCYSGDQHIIDLTNNDRLTSVDIMYCCFFVTNLSTTSLETCRLGTETTVSLNQVCITLNRHCTLRHLELAGHSCFSLDSAANKIISENVTRLLPFLTSLRTLRLQGLTFTTNFMTRAVDIKTLEQIDVCDVSMTLAVWFKFIDSLAALQQSVKVTTRGLYITPTGAGPVNQSRSDHGQVETARQYVRGKMQFFNVTLDNPYVFVFVTNIIEV
ncbi:uncharacterized protein LOC123551701 [Mercenaria mercenaria]|uniref:uncharacterized protein LOC123551701 n=1 Tax=Mercenaria mercenaria TaxID=6596 RepID=UPI00234E49C0|nr:uncharacterized protein LOC123551701 [Mercenaria mercenaria]